MSRVTAASSVGAVVVVAFCVTLLWLAGHEVRASDLVMVMFGMLASKFGTVVDFYFGSSASSRAKDATISGLAARKEDQ